MLSYSSLLLLTFLFPIKGSESASVGVPNEFYVAATRRADNSLLHISAKRVRVEVSSLAPPSPPSPLPCQVVELMTGCLEVVYSPVCAGPLLIRVVHAQTDSVVAEGKCVAERREASGGEGGGEGEEGELVLEISGDGASECVLGKREREAYLVFSLQQFPFVFLYFFDSLLIE